MFSWFRKNKKTDTHNQQEVKKSVPFFEHSIAKAILSDIKKEYGLDYSKQEDIIIRKLERFSLQYNINNFAQLHNQLKESQETKEKLINMLTVGETYFFRELGHFKILVELMQKQPISNILCAPCSSGEEVFSVLLYLQTNLTRSSNISITGIDVNSDAITKAKEGCFSQRAVSFLSNEIKKKYFSIINKKYCIDPALKLHTKFYHQNIFESSSDCLGKFDVIFCRNMLIYFNEQEKKEVLKILYKLLHNNGVLFLGHADISFIPKEFKKIHTLFGNYFQKITL